MRISAATSRSVLLTSVAAAAIASAIYAAGPATQPTASPLPLLVTSPEPAPRAVIAPVPYRPYMAPPTVSHDPRLLPADALHALRRRPALDLPPLADAAPLPPAEPRLPVGPPARIIAVDPAKIPVAALAVHPDDARATLLTDPTIELAQTTALLASPPSRTAPPPAEMLVIPDPSHQASFIPTARPAVEDPPASSTDRPGPTTLPISGK